MPEPRSSESPKPLSWSEWKARNGSKLWCWRAPLAVEWALEWFTYRLRGLALFELLELAGKLTVVVAIVFWFMEADNRAKERHYRAWELINAAAGKAGDGGRRDALQDLNRDGVDLAAAPLENARLPRVDLEGARLAFADLHGAMLGGANLQGAFWAANLQAARNLTQEQLNAAHGDDRTVLPAGVTRPAHWAKAEAPETPPAAQPDTAGRTPAEAGAPDPAK